MFKINWSLITNDECEKLEASLNASFAKLKLPDFVDKISVSEVNLGDVAPLIELMDISAVDPQIKARVAALGLVAPSPAAAGPSGAAAAAAAAAGGGIGGPMSPGGVGVMPAGPGAGLAPRGSFTPKGTFATAGSGTFGSPAAIGALNALHLKPAQSPGAAGGSGVHPSLRRASTSVLSPASAGGHYASTLPTPMTPSALGVGAGPALPLSATHDEDVMIKVKLHYNGNARFNIHSGLLINFPSPGFAALPITLRVSKLSFEGTAMIIKIGQTMYFTFENDPKTGGPLKDVCVESDIGDADKSVLRNARKVEQFIINQLQTLLKEKMVYPRMVPANLPAAGPKPPGGAHAGAAAAAMSPTGASAHALTGASPSTPLPPDFKSKK